MTLVPIFGILGVFFAPGTVLVFFLWFRHRSYCQRQATLRAAIEKGAGPDVLALLDPPSPPADLRLPGLVWLLIGLGAIPGLGLVVNWHVALFALIPVGIGAAYLIAWGLARDDSPEIEAGAERSHPGM